LNDVLDAYIIDFIRINELKNDESKEKAKNEFLSIFDVGISEKASEKIEPIMQDQETKEYTRCIEQIRAMGILKDTSYIIKNVNDEKNWVKLIHLINTSQYTDEIDEKIEWYRKMKDIRKTLKEHYWKLINLPKQLHARVIDPDQIADAYNREKAIICDDEHSRTGTVYKITIGRYSYALKVPRMTGNECEKILSELENEADIYQHLKDM
jgi:hypothetical protein